MTNIHTSRLPRSTAALNALLLLLLSLSGYVTYHVLSLARSLDDSDLRYLHGLAAGEDAYAYARISPDGRLLAYTSQSTRTDADEVPERMVKVVEVSTAHLVFVTPGVDAYWSPDSAHLIFMSEPLNAMAIWSRDTGRVTPGVAPGSLGDYMSWGAVGGVDRILTIRGNYFDLLDRSHAGPIHTLANCPGFGVGLRPLVSRDGLRATVFTVDGTVAVRNVNDCDGIVDTRLPGAKADFSRDGRYIAFHAPLNGKGPNYEILIFDLGKHALARRLRVNGSALFPSWTDDGRLCFRYEGATYRGFVMLDHPLNSSVTTYPTDRPSIGSTWSSYFPKQPLPSAAVTIVLIWAPWSAHSGDARTAAAAAALVCRRVGWDVSVQEALEPSSQLSPSTRLADIDPRAAGQRLLSLSTDAILSAHVHNQMPLVLIFNHGQLVSRLLGAPTVADLVDQVRPWMPAGRTAWH